VKFSQSTIAALDLVEMDWGSGWGFSPRITGRGGSTSVNIPVVSAWSDVPPSFDESDDASASVRFAEPNAVLLTARN